MTPISTNSPSASTAASTLSTPSVLYSASLAMSPRPHTPISTPQNHESLHLVGVCDNPISTVQSNAGEMVANISRNHAHDYRLENRGDLIDVQTCFCVQRRCRWVMFTATIAFVAAVRRAIVQWCEARSILAQASGARLGRSIGSPFWIYLFLTIVKR